MNFTSQSLNAAMRLLRFAPLPSRNESDGRRALKYVFDGLQSSLLLAVAGGLAAATIATLIVLPSVFAILRGRASTHSVSLDHDDPLRGHFVSPVGHD